MPLAGPFRRPPRRARARLARGFTLIEIMVVVVIIAVVAGMAVLSLGSTGRDGQLERERDRLVALIDYVRERAALQTVEYGLRCQQDGYQFVEYDTRKNLWVADELDETLRARPLPAGLELSLAVEDRPIVLPTRAQAARKRDDAGLTPQVMLFSSGEVSRFALTLARPAAQRHVEISAGADAKVQAGELVEPKP